MENKVSSPIMIIGMHRSGTTLLTKLLSKSNVFMGVNLDINAEADFFKKRNIWLMRELGANWDSTYNCNFIDDYFLNKVVPIYKMQFNSLRRIHFTGLNFKQYKLKGLWGWKDPRNTFMIDVWKEIFPNMKIIHIYRNPIDIALSLSFRENQKEEFFKRRKRHKIKETFVEGNIRYSDSYRIKVPFEGVMLWEEYIKKAMDIKNNFGDNYFELKYEDLLENPEFEFKKVLEFIGASELVKVEEIVKEIKSDRKYAFMNSDVGMDLFNRVKDRALIKKLGYD